MKPDSPRFLRSLRQVVERLPTLPPSFTLTCLLNLSLHQVIRRRDLQALYGKRIKIHVTDIGLQLYFTIDTQGFSPVKASSTTDLAISATVHDFYLLAMRKEDPDTLFFNQRLRVEGDTELGLVAKNTLDALEHPMLKLEQFLPKPVFNVIKAKL